MHNSANTRKICFVASGAMPVNAFLHEPIRRLSADNLVYVIANLGPQDSLPCVPNPDRKLAVRIERKISPWRDIMAFIEIVRVFRRYRFDVVHSITPKAGLLAMMAARFCGIRVRIHTFTGQVWATKSGFGRWLLKSTDKLISFLANHILVDSPSQLAFLLEQGVLPACKASVLHLGSVSGVDTQRFKPDAAARSDVRRKLGISDHATIFLFIGRLNIDKGILDLADAFNIVAGRYPDVHLLIVGPDEQQLRAVIRQKTFACADKVHFVDFAMNPQDYMAAADTLCLPSYREGFGNVVIEAAAVSIPAIGSRIYGLTDAIADKETGFLFEPRNIAELTNCMETLASDHILRERMGRQARERVQQDFVADKLTSAWLDYYRELA